MSRNSIVLVFVICFSLLLSSCSNQCTSIGEDGYSSCLNEIQYANIHMPRLSDLGEYEDILIKRKDTNRILWADTYTITLIVQYDELVFIDVKEKIFEQYAILEEYNSKLLDIEADVNGFDIRVVKKEECITGDNGYYYPKYFLMIGVNNATNQVAYLFHHDFDLDTIKDLDGFIRDHYSLD